VSPIARQLHGRVAEVLQEHKLALFYLQLPRCGVLLPLKLRGDSGHQYALLMVFVLEQTVGQDAGALEEGGLGSRVPTHLARVAGENRFLLNARLREVLVESPGQHILVVEGQLPQDVAGRVIDAVLLHCIRISSKITFRNRIILSILKSKHHYSVEFWVSIGWT
jgi:hypothetical protein